MNEQHEQRPGDLANLRPTDDLLWTAYQYTADELPEPAARAFETLLETDQQAREALAEAVALGDTVRAAIGPDSVVAPVVMPASIAAAASGERKSYTGSYGWAAAWVALGAAACLVLTMALRNAPLADPSAPIAEKPAAKTDGRATGPDGVGDHQLLAVLFPEDSDVAGTDSSPQGFVAAISSEPADADLGMYEEAAHEPMPEATAPDWLIAAVVEDGQGANE